MSRGRGVIDYAVCFSETAGSVDSVNGWEAGVSDGLGFVHNLFQFIAVLDRAGAKPSCDTTGKNALFWEFGEVAESCSRNVKFP